MLYSFYKHLLSHLSSELSGTGLDTTHFVTIDPGGISPLFLLEGKEFILKNSHFKTNNLDVLKIDQTDTFAISGTNKKGPFGFTFPLSEITAVTVKTNPGTQNETVNLISSQLYTATGSQITLSDAYPVGSALTVNYKFLGNTFSDRFSQSFSLIITESVQEKLEQYSLLAITAIWTALPEILENNYVASTGTLRADISISELVFNGQTINTEDKVSSVLNFTVNGLANFIKARIDGFNIIEKVKIADNTQIVTDIKGIGIKLS